MKEELGRCLGPTKNEGNGMTQWVLQQNCQIVPRRTLRRLRAAERAPSNEAEAAKRAEFDAAIKVKLGNSFAAAEEVDAQDVPNPFAEDTANHAPDFDPNTFVPYEDEATAPQTTPEADIIDARGRPVNQQSVTDVLINAEVLLPQGESMQMAKVVRRAVD